MIEGRCESCGFWEDKRDIPLLDGSRGTCASEDAHKTCGYMMPSSRFGCRFWKEREPDLREELAEYIAMLLSHIQTSGEHRYVSLGASDDIIAIFEKHRP